jgi:hypothetical protein
VFKSRTLKCAGHVVRREEAEVLSWVCWKNLKEELLGRSRRKWDKNIKMNLRETGWDYGVDRSGSGQGQVAGSCECSNETPGSIKFGEFLELLKNCWLLRKDSASCSKIEHVTWANYLNEFKQRERTVGLKLFRQKKKKNYSHTYM